MTPSTCSASAVGLSTNGGNSTLGSPSLRQANAMSSLSRGISPLSFRSSACIKGCSAWSGTQRASRRWSGPSLSPHTPGTLAAHRRGSRRSPCSRRQARRSKPSSSTSTRSSASCPRKVRVRGTRTSLEGSPMSGSYTRVLPLCLAAALGLTPQLAQAFAFDTAMEPASVLQNQTTGNPVVWSLPQVTMSVHLGSVPPETTLANGTTSWDTNAAEALAFWNTIVPNFFTMDTTEADPCDRRNGINTVTFVHDHCGDSFGDVVAVTRKSY